MKRHAGFSLIELVIFIVVVAIAMGGVAVVLSTLLTRSPLLEQMNEALSVVQGRMEVILGQHYFLGDTNLTDPCATNSTGLCAQSLVGYSVSSVMTPVTLNTDTHYSIVTVTVMGPANTQINLKSLVSGS